MGGNQLRPCSGIVLAILFFLGCQPAGPVDRPAVDQSATVASAPEAATPSSAEESPRGVTLVIRYGDGVEKKFTNLPHKSGMTVFDVINAATMHSHGIKATTRGSGESAFVEKIDELPNGMGDPAKFWLFEVNGKKGEVGAGVAEVQPGDEVVWAFGPFAP